MSTVIVEIDGGCVSNIIAPEDVEVFVYDWDNLAFEDIVCPYCDNEVGFDPYPYTDEGNDFVCQKCKRHFLFLGDKDE